MSLCLKPLVAVQALFRSQRCEGGGAAIQAQSPGSCSHIFEQQDWHSPSGEFPGQFQRQLDPVSLYFSGKHQESHE